MAILRTATLPSALGLVAALFISSGRTQAAAPAGSIQITVDDAQGEPMSGVTIQYTRLPKTVIDGARELPAPGEIAVHGEVATNASGIATVASLPVGNYTLCAAMLGAPFLDPCIWQQPVRVAVTDSGTAAEALTLTKGVFLNVRVNDSTGLLSRMPANTWISPKLLVGVVYGTGAYQAAPVTSVDAAGRSYQLIIPTDEAFSLRLFSSDVTLTDQKGDAVDVSGSRIPLQATPGQDLTFTFNVSGPGAK